MEKHFYLQTVFVFKIHFWKVAIKMCDCQLTGSIRSAYNYNDIERHSDVPGQGCGHGWPDHPPGAGHRGDRGLLP